MAAKIPMPRLEVSYEMENLEKYLLLAQRNTRKTAGEILRKQMRLAILVLMARTPPFKGPADRNLSGHAKIGKAAVGRDVGRVYRMGSQVFAELQAVDVNMAKAWWREFKRGDEKKALKLFQDIGGAREMIGSAQQTGPLERGHHARRRNRRGRVSAKLALQIVSKKDREAYIKEMQAMVMFAKAGWLPAGRAFGMKRLPASLRRHAAPGRFKDRSNAISNPFAWAENGVRYVGRLDRELGITKGALRARDRAMVNDMERLLKQKVWR